MSVITISRGSYSHGKEIAEKVAERLGYECISREILLEASREFNIPELKLFHAIYDAPSMINRILFSKQKYIAYIQCAVLRNLKRDNVVYHGFAGHFFVKDIAHVLKIRIVADMEERIRIMQERNRASRKEAVQFIHKLDKQRKKWSQKLYGIDTADPGLYDLVIHLDTITVDAAVDIICHKAASKRFQTTPESQQKIEDLSLAAETKAFLINLMPDIKVKAQNGSVLVNSNMSAAQKSKIEKEMPEIVRKIPGIKDLQINTLPVILGGNDFLRCEILIVDDEPIVCERLKALLERDGYRVETATDPVKAVQRLEEKEFDIVISDFRMKEIDGVQLMEKVLQKSGRTKVIMITAYATLELARQTLTGGAFDFISKPFKAKEIRETIKRAIESLEQDGQRSMSAGGA